MLEGRMGRREGQRLRLKLRSGGLADIGVRWKRLARSGGRRVTMIDGASSSTLQTSNTLHIPWVFVPLVSATAGETTWRYASSTALLMELHADVPLRCPRIQKHLACSPTILFAITDPALNPLDVRLTSQTPSMSDRKEKH